jgi:hypothetical protein
VLFGDYICSHCEKPTFFDQDQQLPGVAPGSSVEHLPLDVASLYIEARNCVAASCYTAAVLVCRKLLMNIAVAQGANPGETLTIFASRASDYGGEERNVSKRRDLLDNA